MLNRCNVSLLPQTNLLETALDLHGKLAPSDTQPLHNMLIEVGGGVLIWGRSAVRGVDMGRKWTRVC